MDYGCSPYAERKQRPTNNETYPRIADADVDVAAVTNTSNSMVEWWNESDGRPIFDSLFFFSRKTEEPMPVDIRYENPEIFGVK